MARYYPLTCLSKMMARQEWCNQIYHSKIDASKKSWLRLLQVFDL